MNGDIMHKVNIDEYNMRTDLIVDQENKNIKSKEIYKYKDISVINSKNEKYNYTTIFFKDITDKNAYLNVQKVLKEELERYIKVKKNDKFLIIGLGNKNATPDALGPNTMDKILVTRHLFLLGDVSDDYSNVSIYKPDVIGNTGIESIGVIKSLIKDISPTKVIIIDSLKASKLERLSKTIQITDSGIHPGSGISNDRGEISKKTMNCDVIAIGIPTVVDINTIVQSSTKKSVDLEDNFIVTPTDIDFLTEKLSTLLASTLNILLHKSYLRQINKE